MASLCVAYRTKQLYIIFACLPLKEKKKAFQFPWGNMYYTTSSGFWFLRKLSSDFICRPVHKWWEKPSRYSVTGRWQLFTDSSSSSSSTECWHLYTSFQNPFFPRVMWKGQIATRVLSCFVGREFIIKRNKNVHPAFCLKGSTVSISQHCFPCKRTRTDNECPLPCKTQ